MRLAFSFSMRFFLTESVSDSLLPEEEEPEEPEEEDPEEELLPEDEDSTEASLILFTGRTIFFSGDFNSPFGLIRGLTGD